MHSTTFPSRSASASRPSIFTILEVAGADRWSPEAIEAHKAAELAKVPPSRLYPYQPLINGLILDAKEVCLYAVVFSLIGIALVGAVAFWDLLQSWGLPGQLLYWSSVICLSGAAIGAAALTVLTIIGKIRIRTPAYWSEVRLVTYHRDPKAPYPSEAEALVKAVRALVPGCSFTVESLWQGTVLLDPVLWFHDETDTVHVPIKVWGKDGTIIRPTA
ncbi:MAG: hypothetical protein AAB964_02810 [Patescibacteria group bacterium]